jgi:predicted DNA-binding protein
MILKHIPQSILKRLEALSIRTNRSKEYFVLKSLERYLTDEEDLADAIIAYDHFLKSGKKSYSIKDVYAQNQIDD